MARTTRDLPGYRNERANPAGAAAHHAARRHQCWRSPGGMPQRTSGRHGTWRRDVLL